MISISLVNPPKTTAPFNLAENLTATMATLPTPLHDEFQYQLPDQPGSEGDLMTFDPSPDREALLAARAAIPLTSTLRFRLGTKGFVPSGPALVSAIAAYQGVASGLDLDNATDDPVGSPSYKIANEILAQGFSLGLEANNKSNTWVRDLIQQYPSRISILAAPWLWLTPNARRFTLQEVIDLGGTPVVELNRKSNSKGSGWPTLADAAWPDVMVGMALMAHTAGAKVAIRSAKLNEWHKSALAACN